MDKDKKHDDDLTNDEIIEEVEELEKDDDYIESEIVDDDSEDSEVTEEVIEDDFNEFKDKYQRLLADFTNYKQREEASKVDFKKFAVSNLIEKLLPVLDNFDRALNGADENDPLVQGIVMTRDEMLSILAKEGLEEIASDGEVFDYNLHQAVLTEESDEVEEDHIIETFQKGYKLNNRVIRPAMVKVAK